MAQTYTVKKGDTLNAIASQYGFKDYKAAGITGYKSGNADLIRPGEVLTIGNYKAPTPANAGTATSIINANQDDDIANTPSRDDAPSKTQTRTSRYSTAFSEIKDIITPAGSSPAAPNFSDLYNKTRKDLNIDDLEGYVNELQTEEEQIYADLRARRTDERGKTVATNVIEGRIGQAERQEAERIDYITRQKNSAVRQLQSANATIENIINFTKLDYDTARNSYNDQFSQQMSLFNTVKGIVDSEITDEERDADRSRANLNIIYSSIREGEVDTKSLTPEMQYTINKMELSAGLPTGFYENIKNQNPNGKILSTTTRTSGNAKYADVLMRNDDGSISVKSVYLGADASGSGSGSSTEDKKIEAFRSDAQKYILQLEGKEIGWGGAFNALKAKYPEASNELVDATLKKDAYYNTTPKEDGKTYNIQVGG